MTLRYSGSVSLTINGFFFFFKPDVPSVLTINVIIILLLFLLTFCYRFLFLFFLVSCQVRLELRFRWGKGHYYAKVFRLYMLHWPQVVYYSILIINCLKLPYTHTHTHTQIHLLSYYVNFILFWIARSSLLSILHFYIVHISTMLSFFFFSSIVINIMSFL